MCRFSCGVNVLLLPILSEYGFGLLEYWFCLLDILFVDDWPISRWNLYMKSFSECIPNLHINVYYLCLCFIQVFRKQDTDSTHIMLQQLAKHYGPVLKMPDLGTDVLLVSGFEEIYQVNTPFSKYSLNYTSFPISPFLWATRTFEWNVVNDIAFFNMVLKFWTLLC